MNHWIVGALLLLTACKPRDTEAGLLAKVTIDPGLVSKCMQVEIGANGTRRNSSPVLLAGKSLIYVGIAQGTFPDQVEVRALGYVDEACQTRAREESLLVSATFDKTAIRDVMLTLKKVLPKTETECSDGLDDDDDGTRDCGDSDCNDKACTTTAQCLMSTRCMNGSCGGDPKRCLTPPTTCFQPVGTCSPNDGSCQYSVAMAAQCDDNDVCTTQDTCELDGGCRGAPVSCLQSGNSCLEGTGGCVDGGCTFAPKIDAGCDDSDSCTVTDRCGAQGTCSGNRVTCAPTSCRTFTNQCNADGGCIFAMVDAGTSCDGGVCTLAGDCLPRFPYQPVNFDVTDLRAPPPMPTVLDCGETTIDTSATGNMRLDNWCRGQPFEATVLRQANGPEVLLVSTSGLTITNDGGLTIIGSRPVIFAVFGDVDITGQVVTRAGAPLCTTGNGNDGASELLGTAGGSGAGFSTPGGAGGTGVGAAATTAGGAEAQAGPTPLRGGCRGGRGGEQSGTGAEGGGAVQISASGTMSINGVLAAPGRGGARGTWQAFKGMGGNGGGSGGMIVLEATTLTISGGAVTANGGGGGEGGGLVIGADGNPGADGALASSTPASGGSGGALVGGEGGQGGAISLPTSGANNTSGGGGGGAPGRLFFRGPGTCSIGPQVILSPQPALDGGCP